MKATLLSQLLLVGLALIGAFLTVWVVSLLLPNDPLNPLPDINYTGVFVASLVVYFVFLEVALATGRRLATEDPVDARVEATVSHYNADRRYGFAVLDDGREAFFHSTKLVHESDREKLKRGTRLSFFLEYTNVGDRPAANMIEVMD